MTLFGRDTGRLSALARGARKSQRRFAGGLSLCAVGTAAVRERPGAELATLERFDATEQPRRVRLRRGAHGARRLRGRAGGKAVRAPAGGASGLRLAAGVPAATRRGRRQRRAPARVRDRPASRSGVRPGARHLRRVRRRRLRGRPPAEVAFRWDPDRGGAVCTACARGGRPMQPAVRQALIRLARTPLGRCGRRSPARGRQPRLPRGAARDHQPSHERPAEDGGIHCQGRARRRAAVTAAPRRCSASVTSRSTSPIWRRPSASGSTSWATRSSGGPDPDNVYLHGARDNLALHRQGRGRRRAASTTSGSRWPRPPTWTPGRRTCDARRRREGGAEDPPRRLAVALLPRPRRAAHPDHPPRAAGGLNADGLQNWGSGKHHRLAAQPGRRPTFGIREDQAAIDALARSQLRLAGQVARVTDHHVVSHDAGHDHVRSHVEVAAIEAELPRLPLIVAEREVHPDESVALLGLEDDVRPGRSRWDRR